MQEAPKIAIAQARTTFDDSQGRISVRVDVKNVGQRPAIGVVATWLVFARFSPAREEHFEQPDSPTTNLGTIAANAGCELLEPNLILDDPQHYAAVKAGHAYLYLGARFDYADGSKEPQTVRYGLLLDRNWPSAGGMAFVDRAGFVTDLCAVSNDQPFNIRPLYGTPVKGMVLVHEHPVVARDFAGRVTIYTDILFSHRCITRLRESTERFIADGTDPPSEATFDAHLAWSAAVTAYGRCFITPDGRRALTAADVERLNGDMKCHEELIDWRNSEVAHCTQAFRLGEVFAVLAEPPEPRRVKSLNIMEHYGDLPSLHQLRAYECHLMRMDDSFVAEMKKISARISSRLTEDNCEELYECMERGTKWSA